jgi:membrane-bound serine protease (ClpP class)
MLTIGSAYLFVDENRRPLVNLGPAGLVSIFGGLFIWLTVQRRRTAGKAPFIGDTLVGMTGEVWVAIEPFSPGSVRIEGELWRARSQENIPAGSTVRVLRQDGITVTVMKVEAISKERQE